MATSPLATGIDPIGRPITDLPEYLLPSSVYPVATGVQCIKFHQLNVGGVAIKSLLRREWQIKNIGWLKTNATSASGSDTFALSVVHLDGTSTTICTIALNVVLGVFVASVLYGSMTGGIMPLSGLLHAGETLVCTSAKNTDCSVDVFVDLVAV